MAQLQGTFRDDSTALQAVQRLRAMDIPDEDIVISHEGKGADAYVLVTAEVPDGQFSAAQAVVSAAVAGGGVAQGESARSTTMPDDMALEDLSEEAGGGALAGGLAGAAVAGPVGAVAGAALGATGGAAAADAVDADDDTVTYSGRGRIGTAGEVLGTRTDEGATADPDVAAMAGPGVIGHGALGGPAALTARAAAIGSADELRDEPLGSDDPDNQGDTINSVSPR
jgi:hypothetical protein